MFTIYSTVHSKQADSTRTSGNTTNRHICYYLNHKSSNMEPIRIPIRAIFYFETFEQLLLLDFNYLYYEMSSEAIGETNSHMTIDLKQSTMGEIHSRWKMIDFAINLPFNRDVITTKDNLPYFCFYNETSFGRCYTLDSSKAIEYSDKFKGATDETRNRFFSIKVCQVHGSLNGFGDFKITFLTANSDENEYNLDCKFKWIYRDNDPPPQFLIHNETIYILNTVYAYYFKKPKEFIGNTVNVHRILLNKLFLCDPSMVIKNSITTEFIIFVSFAAFFSFILCMEMLYLGGLFESCCPRRKRITRKTKKSPSERSKTETDKMDSGLSETSSKPQSNVDNIEDNNTNVDQQIPNNTNNLIEGSPSQ